MDEKTRRDFRARDRSSRYLQCTHVVSINGKRYEYEHVVDSSFAPDSIADWEAKCRSAETKRRLVEHLRASTEHCRNLTGGEHWGLQLRPVDAGDGQ